MEQILEWLGDYIWLAAFVLGALHALQPGHGKTLVAAYLVGTRGTVKDALLLGVVVTVTHTMTIYVLAGVAQASTALLPMEKIESYLGAFASLLILLVGLLLVQTQWRRHKARTPHAHDHSHDDSHDHSHGDAHAHGHDHPDGHHQAQDHFHPPGFRHEHPDPVKMTSLRNVFLLGISAGIVPCPEGLAVFLASLASGQMETGLLLVMVFSFGLATSLMVIGIAFLKASRLFAASELAGQWGDRVAWTSAVLITGVGIIYMGMYLAPLYG